MKEKQSGSGKLTFRVVNNTLAFAGGEFFYHLVNFFSGVMIARSLGKEQYGQFSFIFVYLSLFEIFTQFGMNSILTRELAQKKETADELLGNAVLLRLALIIFSLPLVFFIVRGLGYPLSVQQSVWIASFQLFLGIRSIFETVFRTNLKMVYPAAWNALRAVLNLGLVAVVALRGPAIPFFIGAYLVSGFVGLVGLGWFSRRFVRIRFRPRWPLISYLIRESAPLLTAGYLTLLYCRIDVLMLSKMKSFSEVGYYSVATRLAEPLDMISNSLMISLFPLLSRSFKENRKEFEAFSSQAFSGLLLVGLPVALGGGFVAKDLVHFFFGEEYLPSGVTLGILFWYTFFGFLSTFFVNLLMACGRQIVDAWLSFLLLLGNIGLNLLLIPKLSYNGAALATVLTELIGTSAMFLYASRHREIKLSFLTKELVTALKINAVFALLLLGFNAWWRMPWGVFIGLGVFSYGALLLLFKAVSWDRLKNYLSHWTGGGGC